MDVFDDNPEEDDFRVIGEANFRKMQQKLTKVGYVDGIAEGEETGRQAGFDAGFADGMLTGFEIGKFESLFKLLEELTAADNKKLTALDESELIIYKNLNITEVENKAHCKYLEHKDETTAPSISQHQREYIKEMAAQLRQKLPSASKFLEKNNGGEVNDQFDDREHIIR